jgi:hypothetical protein
LNPHKLTQKEAESLSRLLMDKDFSVFMEYLGRVAEAHNKALVMSTFEVAGKMYTLQGQTREVATLIETIASAPDKLKEFKNPQR